ncbi:hypothetical protein JG687_00004216 [Phytophthora cactorum]|uniref:Uncharacterized protein n=1 Tax=Phytophthora cactorum TaxID=29920 RepID=A0A8T1UU00_9STRA|nr:hypothetical protein PC120_g3895 [Phytophthora cactorum]KAG3093120.1 hypothetical protein PC121_g3384 [Phytophthora cactorum]KAG3191142.1 hypothetical protein PC128_g11073 [Phytophthora cactorum]KAG4056669.1 hypothetical protein PC123_g8276 [Phytophthora cactorum]KAG6967534.1 hypothetical protein JG687_00004216 [Phytophthora cactorum]
MARADDDEALRRRGRARPRAPPPTSIASMYAPVDASNGPPARSSKMKMASLMAVVDEESKSKRVKVDEQQSDSWAPRNAPISISSLTTSSESPASSLFQHEMPTIIPSFSRDAVEANGEAKNGAANGDASPVATRSMLDYYFPSGRSESNGSSGNRSLKRKRRSARRDELAVDVDLLRFGVDVAKLVPQGLVDRVDAHMSRAVLLKVVDNHVTNWCNRSGFAPSFLQELTTLLAAYYPCNYPTLLDEVLAGFLFKRPEFMDLLLPAMLEKMSKAGESVSTTKYPVADALVRMCGSAVTTARHDLACRSLLRCLVENNGDRFALSPWIAACALESSDSVLQILWRALLPRSQDQEELDWRVEDPAQQIVELLAEEGKLRLCRITCGFVKLLLSDDILKKQLVDAQSYLIRDCLERAFKYASTSWSSSLMAEWLERRRRQQLEEGKDDAGSLKDLVAFFVRFNAKLSAKKPEWFVNHVLSFVLSPHCHVAEQEPALRAILRDHLSFLFGAQSLAKQNGSSEASAAADLDVVGSQSVLEVQRKIELLLGLLIAATARTSALFLDIWSQAWSDKRVTLSWSCVRALISVTIQDTVEDRSVLGQKLQSFTIRACRSYYRRLSHLDKDEKVASKFSEALNLLLPSTSPVAGLLLQEVLAALADLEQKHSTDACSIFGNAVVLHLGGCGECGVDSSVKRSVVQKSLVEYDRSPVSFPKTADLLSTLQTLASTENDTGDFTRRVLSSGPLVRLLSSLLNFGRRRHRQEMLLDVMNVVVSSNTSAKLNRDWARQYVVQELVHCAYTGPPNSARKATALLQNIFRHSTNDIRALLWVVLQQCTKLCCGREEKAKADNSALNYQGRADTFAELVKAMVVTVPASTVREVLSFVEQKLASCSVGKTRMNLFLLLLLRKLVVCEVQCGVLLPVVQLAVCPLAPSDLDQIRLIQLQLLKALCTRLAALRHRPVASMLSDESEAWKRCEDLVCNERLQADLRSMVKGRTSRVSEVLAQGILAFTHQLRHQSPIDEEDEARRRLKRSRMK